jgi:hypothetical protein
LTISFQAPLWKWQSVKAPQAAAWHFVTLPLETAAEIRFFGARQFSGAKKQRGWGSIPVKSRIGTTSWKTSLFPDSKSGSYLLPVKADVREAEALHVDEIVEVELTFSSIL